MAISNYDKALTLVLKYEGGYTNHPSDPGGPTNWGITINDARMYWKKTATANDVKNMPIEVAKAIYKTRYWDAQRCSELPSGVDYAIMDHGVNSGIGRSGKVLRRALGLSDKTSLVDSSVIAAAMKADPIKLINYIMSERLAFLKSLKTWPTFGKGWGARVVGVKSAALAMASGAAPKAEITIIASQPEPQAKGVVPVNTKGQTASVGSAIAVGTTTATTQSHSPLLVVLSVIATIALIAGAVWFFKWKQKRDQEAPVNVALAT